MIETQELKNQINQFLLNNRFKSDINKLYENHVNGKNNARLNKILKDKGYSKNPYNIRYILGI